MKNKKQKNPENPAIEIVSSNISEIKIGDNRNIFKDKIGYTIASVLNTLLILFVFIDPYVSLDKTNIHSFYLIPIILLAVVLFGIILTFKKKFLYGLIPIFIIMGKFYVDCLIGKDIETSSIHYMNFFVLASVVCFFNIDSPNFIMESILTFLYCCAFLLNGYEFSLTSYAMIACHLFILKVLRTDSFYGEFYYKGAGAFITVYNNKSKNKKIALTREKEYNTAVNSAVVVFCAVAGIILCTGAILNAVDYQRADRVKRLRSNLIQATEEFDTQHPFESLDTFIKAFKNEDLPSFEPGGISHDGKLGDNGNIRYDKIDVIDIVSNRIDAPVYLKGVSYGDYNGKGWDKTDPEYRGDIVPQNFYGRWISEYKKFMRNLVLNNYVDIPENSYMEINFLNKKSVRNGITYAPYFSLDLNTNSDIGYTANNPQSFITSFNQNSEILNAEYFDYEDYRDINIDYDNLADILSGYFIQLRSDNNSYRDYANQFLDLPNTPAIKRIREDYISYYYMHSLDYVSRGYYDENVEHKLNRIKNYIQKDTYYTLNAGVTPKTEDFVEYFLFTQKKGSCSYYASAGTLLCRMMGIPARYCEGYVIFPSDYEKSTQYVNYSKTNTEYRNYKIKDERAHAWTEVYIDGLGWIPYEFTPGYDSNIAYSENPPALPVTSSDNKTTDVTTEGKGTSGSRTETNIVASKSVTTTSKVTTTITTANKKDENSFKINTDVIFWILIVILITAAIFLPYLRYVKNCVKYKFFGTETNAIALHYYSYIIDLLKFGGHIRGNDIYKDFAEHIEENSVFFDGNFKKATEIAEKAKFDENIISAEEALFIKTLSQQYFKDVYENSKFFKKINLKFLGYEAIF